MLFLFLDSSMASPRELRTKLGYSVGNHAPRCNRIALSHEHQVIITMWISLVFAILLLIVPESQSSDQIPLIHSEPIFPSACNRELSSRLDKSIGLTEDLMKIGGAAGMSIGIMSRRETILEHSFGFADIEKHLVSNSSTIYPLASLTKAFVAATVAQLVDNGALDWNEPLKSYIPELSFDADDMLASRLTLIDILSHQSGLSRLDALWLGASSQVIIPKNYTVTVCNNLTPIFSLRSKWLYNNWMYALAGEVIERVTNQSLGEILASRIFAKLGLSQTTLIGSEVPADSTALPYLILENETSVRVPVMEMTDGHLMSSAGGIRSSVVDMLKWGNILLSIFRDEETPLKSLDTILSGHAFLNKTSISDELYTLGFAKVITPSQLGKIGSNQDLLGEMPTLGAKKRPEIVFYHSGGGMGYDHCFMLVPGRQTSIVVLTNSIAHGDIADWAAQTLLQAVLGDDEPVDLRPFAEKAAAKWRSIYNDTVEILECGRSPDTPAPAFEELVGRFWHETGALWVEVFVEDGVLKFNFSGRKEQEHVLSHYHFDTFVFLPSAEERLSRVMFHYIPSAWLLYFKRGSEGGITHVVWEIDELASEGEVFMRVKKG